MRKFFLPSLLTVLIVPVMNAAPVTFEITVGAEKHDRANVPVRRDFTVPKGADTVHATLLDADGKFIPCQVTGISLDADVPGAARGLAELHFILPKMKAGKTAKFKAIVDTESPVKAKGSFTWHDTKGESAELRLNDKPVLRYMYKALDDSSKDKRDATFKVYHHLFDPTGTRLVSKGETTGLYPHHRGIFYGFKTVTYDGNKVVDIWHCTGETYQGHEKVISEETGPVLGRHRVLIGWHGKDKELFANEERELTVYNVPGGRLVEFTSRLTPVKGTVKLDGDPQHSGFHFRAHNDVNDKKNETYFLRPSGLGKKGEERNWPAQKEQVDLPWDAMSFVLGDKRYTVAYLDKPTNPKEARYSERTYGRFGSYFVTEVTDKKPLTVNYRLWLQEGEMKKADVEALSADFVDPVAVTVK
jgi:hypothetical protein